MFYVENLRTEFRSCISITAKVEELVAKSGVQEGLCIVALPRPVWPSPLSGIRGGCRI